MYLSNPKNIFLSNKYKIETKISVILKKMESQKFKTDMFSIVQVR